MATPDAPVTIKKYANRRLYNTATSTYVTHDDLAAMVKRGSPPGENKKPRWGARRVAMRPLRMFVRLARRKNTSVDNQKRLWILTFFAARIIVSRVANMRLQLEQTCSASVRPLWAKCPRPVGLQAPS